MKTWEQDLEEVKALSSLKGNCQIFWSEGGGGDVYRIWDMLFLFEIPHYGGESRFIGAFRLDEAEKLVETAHTWT